MSKTPLNDSHPVVVGTTTAARPRPLSSPLNHGRNMHTSNTKPPAAAIISPRLTREVSKSDLCLSLDGGVRRRRWRRRRRRRLPDSRPWLSGRPPRQLHAAHDHRDRPDQREEDAELLVVTFEDERGHDRERDDARGRHDCRPGSPGRLAVFPVEEHRSDRQSRSGRAGRGRCRRCPRTPTRSRVTSNQSRNSEMKSSSPPPAAISGPLFPVQSDLRQIGFRSVGDSNRVIGGIWGE